MLGRIFENRCRMALIHMTVPLPSFLPPLVLLSLISDARAELSRKANTQIQYRIQFKQMGEI